MGEAAAGTETVVMMQGRVLSCLQNYCIGLKELTELKYVLRYMTIFVRRLGLRVHLIEHLISSSTTPVVFLCLSEPLFSAYAGLLMGGTSYHQRQRQYRKHTQEQW